MSGGQYILLTHAKELYAKIESTYEIPDGCKLMKYLLIFLKKKG